MKTEFVSETSEFINLLTRLSARANFLVTVSHFLLNTLRIIYTAEEIAALGVQTNTRVAGMAFQHGRAPRKITFLSIYRLSAIKMSSELVNGRLRAVLLIALFSVSRCVALLTCAGGPGRFNRC